MRDIQYTSMKIYIVNAVSEKPEIFLSNVGTELPILVVRLLVIRIKIESVVTQAKLTKIIMLVENMTIKIIMTKIINCYRDN